MKTLNDYLNDAATVTGSDRQTALHLGVTPQYLSKARHGDSFSDDAAFNLAEILGISLEEMLAAVNARRTTSDKMRIKWEKAWRKATAACLIMTLGVASYIVDIKDVSASVDRSGIYIMRSIRRFLQKLKKRKTPPIRPSIRRNFNDGHRFITC